MPWAQLPIDSDDDVIRRCIECLQIADPHDHNALNVTAEKKKLAGQYRETDGSFRDVYRLWAYHEEPYVDADSIELVVAFHKTIAREPSNLPTTDAGHARIGRRHWCFSIGFDSNKTAEEMYAKFRARLVEFFENERDTDPTTGEKVTLAIYSEVGYTPDPNGMLDAINDLFEAEIIATPPTIDVDRSAPDEPAYEPFLSHLRNISPGEQNPMLRKTFITGYTPIP